MSFRLRDLHRFHLGNGLTILTREEHTTPIVTSMIWYRVGSRHEQPGSTGTSHFLEHMMFKGTKRFGKGEIDYITTRNGGFNNAFTSLDYTAYYFSFASDRWRQALEIESDRMRNNVFDPIEFELERRVILEEMRMELDQPWEILRQAVALAAFEQHPYRFPVIGLHEDVADLTISKVRRHYENYYLPSNATLVIVGDFPTDEIMTYVQDLFGTLPDVPAPRFSTTSEIWPSAKVELKLEHPTTIPRLLLGLSAPAVNDRHLCAFHILDKLLTEGKLSRLFHRLIEKDRLASRVTSEISETRDPFLLLVRVDLRKQTELGAVEAALREELFRLTQEVPVPEEVNRAKKQCILSYLSDLETTSDQAFNIGLYETLNRLDLLTDYCQQIEAVSPEDVTAAACRFLRVDEAIVASMLPDSPTNFHS